jgi:hypothetical protein
MTEPAPPQVVVHLFKCSNCEAMLAYPGLCPICEFWVEENEQKKRGKSNA